jgi:hypothetical protein
MKRTPFRPLLERLEERETPAAVAVSSSTSSLIVAGAGSLPLLTILQQVRTDVSTMTSLNTKLTTDTTTLKNDITAGATSQTIAGAFGQASSDFGQISALNTSVQSLSKNGQLSALLSLVAGFTAGKTASHAKTTNNNNGDTDDNNNDSDDNTGTSSKSSAMTMMTSTSQIGLGIGLITLLGLSQEMKQASTIFGQANTTASETLPNGFPTVASTVTA